MMDKDILEMFQTIINKVDSLSNEVKEVRQEVTEVRQEVTELKQDHKRTDRELQELKIVLENETNQKINLKYESHQAILEKLDKVEEIDTMKDQISDNQRAIIYHTSQIAELEKKIQKAQ